MEVTLARCNMCGQFYQASEHHKCLLKPTQSNIINAINKATEDAKKPQLIKPLWFETLEKEIRADERKKAEQDFQNSDYWNDYLAKVLADEREKSVKNFAEWLPKHFDLRFAINPNVWLDEYFNHTSEKLKEQKK